MISIEVVFWLLLIFFTLIGYLRGWQKEVIALTGLIASIAALNQFGFRMVTLASGATGQEGLLALRQQFWVQTLFHVAIAFFSYQVIVRLTEATPGGRLGMRVRAALEKRIIGAIIGAINGYLLIGSLWGFLEYRITPNGYVRLAPGEFYPFDPSVIARPPVGSSAYVLAEWLPLGLLSPTVWLILFFIAFFIVIIALI